LSIEHFSIGIENTRFRAELLYCEGRGLAWFMPAAQEVRIDKWLWAVRLYKTRSLAAEACRGGHVTIASQAVKPSREVRVGDVVNARTGEILRTVKVTGLIERRVGAKVAPMYMEDQTSAEEYLRVMKQKEQSAAVPQRPKGAGRPTKRERREIEALERGSGVGDEERSFH
jgi:ribosome-associated heat shock protein Hsp15